MFLKSVLICIIISFVLVWTCIVIDLYKANMDYWKSESLREEMFYRGMHTTMKRYLKGDLL